MYVNYIIKLPYWTLQNFYFGYNSPVGGKSALERITQTRTPIIGSNIARLCKEQNLKYSDVIAKLNVMGIDYVTTGIFSKVIHGHNNPSVEMLIALTDILKCDFNEFFK